MLRPSSTAIPGCALRAARAPQVRFRTWVLVCVGARFTASSISHRNRCVIPTFGPRLRGPKLRDLLLAFRFSLLASRLSLFAFRFSSFESQVAVARAFRPEAFLFSPQVRASACPCQRAHTVPNRQAYGVRRLAAAFTVDRVTRIPTAQPLQDTRGGFTASSVSPAIILPTAVRRSEGSAFSFYAIGAPPSGIHAGACSGRSPGLSVRGSRPSGLQEKCLRLPLALALVLMSSPDSASPD
jgi:hypothetical protein